MVMELYRTDIGSRRCCLGIVYYCLVVAVQNARVLCRKLVGQHKQSKYMPLKKFGSNIASDLTHAGNSVPKKRGHPSINEVTWPPKDEEAGLFCQLLM